MGRIWQNYGQEYSGVFFGSQCPVAWFVVPPCIDVETDVLADVSADDTREQRRRS